MTENNFNLDSYFERINYTGKADISETTLKELHIAHTLNIPFENLDVYYKRPINLEPESLFTKLVENRRGGYCFEMNGLFSLVLRKLGFNVKNLLARGTLDGIDYIAKTHQVLLVEHGADKWLVDVGFGNDGIMAPLLLREGSDQIQFAHAYRIARHDRFGYVLQKKRVNDYDSLYAFTLDECQPMDFLMSNHFTSTFPGSFFLTMRMVTMPTREGRITLTDSHLKIASNGQISEQPVSNDNEFNSLLREYFDLELDLIRP